MAKVRGEAVSTLEDKVFPITPAAEYAGCHPQTLRDAARTGELAYIRRGNLGHYKFRRSALDRWLSRYTTQARKGYQG
jgi:excisionase family DNA binding protein